VKQSLNEAKQSDVCGKCRTQFILSMEKSVTFTGACANDGRSEETLFWGRVQMTLMYHPIKMAIVEL
jgi:hypothetical protein